MLLGEKQKLEEQIVVALTAYPGITAKKIHQIISKKFLSVSIQAIYQRLSSLEKNRVVSKVRDRYTLKLSWIFKVSSLMDSAYQEYVRTRTIEDVFFNGKTTQRWDFISLRKLVAFYSQISLLLCENAEDKTLYDWVPHVWYHFAHREDESDSMRSLRMMGVKYLLAVGGNSLLDRSYQQFFDLAEGEIRFGASDFLEVFPDCCCVAGDYIFTVSLGKELKQSLFSLYKSSLNKKEIDFGRVANVITMESSSRLSVKRHPTKAKSIKKKFKEFFEVG